VGGNSNWLFLAPRFGRQRRSLIAEFAWAP
jgi:hypothetical protein